MLNKQKIKEKYPNFDEFINEMKSEIDVDFIENIKTLFDHSKLGFEELLDFKFKIIVDNNFILGQIRNIVNGKTKIENSFFMKICDLPFIAIYSPPKLKEELYRKIDEKLHVYKNEAIKIAKQFLTKIKIEEAKFVDSYIRAKREIGHRDHDDEAYLALAYDIDSDGVLSYDGVFKEQNLIGRYTISDVDKVSTNISDGILSICILGSTEIVIVSLVKVIAVILGFIFKIIKEIFDVIVSILKMIGRGLLKLPKVLFWIFLGLYIAGLCLSKDFRDKHKDFFDWMVDNKDDIYTELSDNIFKFVNYCEKTYEVVKPYSIVAAEISMYLIDSYCDMKEEIDELEARREKL